MFPYAMSRMPHHRVMPSPPIVIFSSIPRSYRPDEYEEPDNYDEEYDREYSESQGGPIIEDITDLSIDDDDQEEQDIVSENAMLRRKLDEQSEQMRRIEALLLEIQKNQRRETAAPSEDDKKKKMEDFFNDLLSNQTKE